LATIFLSLRKLLRALCLGSQNRVTFPGLKIKVCLENTKTHSRNMVILLIPLF